MTPLQFLLEHFDNEDNCVQVRGPVDDPELDAPYPLISDSWVEGLRNDEIWTDYCLENIYIDYSSHRLQLEVSSDCNADEYPFELMTVDTWLRYSYPRTVWQIVDKKAGITHTYTGYTDDLAKSLPASILNKVVCGFAVSVSEHFISEYYDDARRFLTLITGDKKTCKDQFSEELNNGSFVMPSRG